MHVVERLKGKSGYLTLTKLTVNAADRDEHLLFSGFDDGGVGLDQETMEKLFTCQARGLVCQALEPAVAERLAAAPSACDAGPRAYRVARDAPRRGTVE